ncbi:MAG: hypothetical protein HOV80_25200 [Polyangiaceae bacterium]|nr:hypothetical protein [Polyangiaceae bacterium]
MNALSKFVAAIALALPLTALAFSPATASGDTGDANADDDMTLIAPIAPPANDEPASSIDDAQKAAWEKQLRAARTKQIAQLKAYRERGEFAMNIQGRGLAFVWRDDAGRLCAMAHLVNASGRTDLVDRVAKEDNDLQLASVTEGDLYEWMLHSGLTKEEIQLIQEPAFEIPNNDSAARLREWETNRKREHLASVVERLEMTTDASIATAVDRLAAHADSKPGW